MKKSRTVFLVDDDADDQEVFALALAEVDNSISCVTARNGMEALAQLKESRLIPDWIFLDLNMPRMNGKQCLKEIKGLRELMNVPVIIYSTSCELRDIEETKALGASAFISKPPKVQELINALQGIFLQF